MPSFFENSGLKSAELQYNSFDPVVSDREHRVLKEFLMDTTVAVLAATFSAAFIFLSRQVRRLDRQQGAIMAEQTAAQQQHDADIQAIKDAQSAETTARLAADTREAALIKALQDKIDGGGGATHAELMEILANSKAEAKALDATDVDANPPATGGTVTEPGS